MKTQLIASLFVICVGTAQANSISLDNCQIDLNGKFGLKHNTMQIEMGNRQQLTISPNSELSINGQSVSLEPEQQRWVRGYHKHLSEAAPMAAELAVETVAVAQIAVGQVMQALLGDDYQNPQLNDKLQALGERVKARFYAEDGSLHIQSASLHNDLEDEQFTDELQQLVQQAVSQSVGRLLLALGEKMLSGDGEGEDFETRMQGMADDLEQQIESQAAHLKHKAKSLCELLKQAEHYENKLNSASSELRSLNLLNSAHRTEKI